MRHFKHSSEKWVFHVSADHKHVTYIEIFIWQIYPAKFGISTTSHKSPLTSELNIRFKELSDIWLVMFQNDSKMASHYSPIVLDLLLQHWLQHGLLVQAYHVTPDNLKDSQSMSQTLFTMEGSYVLVQYPDQSFWQNKLANRWLLWTFSQ